MGVASSTSNDKAIEQAFIRSLGDRYPLGDAELRKWCWCYTALQQRSSPQISSGNRRLDDLSSLALWSVIYNNPGPSVSNYNALKERLESAKKLSQTLSIIEEHILPSGLSSRIIEGLGLSVNDQTPPKQSTPFPKPSASNEEIYAWEYSYYSINSCISPEGVSYELQDFLEGISSSCGRRGSRSGLSKLFNLASLSNSQGRKAANASELIDIAYRLTVATSYLLHVTKSKGGTTDYNHNNQDWKSFLPSSDSTGIQSMVDSLLNAAKKQREQAGSFGYSSYPTSGQYTTNSSSSNATDDNNDVYIEEFLEWAETTVPMMASSLSTFLHVLFNFFCQKNEGNTHRFPPGVTPLLMPALSIDQTDKKPASSGPASSPLSTFFSEANTSSDLFALASMSITLASGRFHRLFSSEADGLSCNRLMNALIGYGGPTLIIIRSKNIKGKCGSSVFGAFTYSPWDRESGEFYGNSDSFLFRLGPEPMGVYRPKGSGGVNESNFMFFNSEARSKGYDQLAWGIGFGGTAQEPRFYIVEVLDGSTAKDKDLTFDNGPLLSNKDESNSYCGFDVEAIEAFGLGSSQVIEDAMNARAEYRKEAQERIRNAMKGAKAAFLEDMQSGLVGTKVFKHRDEMRGRDGGCDMDEED